jgi:2'-5' RNA ligase
MFLPSRCNESVEYQVVSTTFLGNDSAWRSLRGQGACEQTRLDKVFLAIKPDDEAARRIHRVAEIIKHARGFKGDLIDSERLHITLFFLGTWEDFSEKMIAGIYRAAAALKEMPFEVTLDRTMSFRNQRGNYAFVLAGDGGVDRLRAFHRLLGAELTRNGLRRWVHTISTPHITLLYDQRIVDEQPIEPISWTAREVMLVRSLHGRKKHRELARWELRG